MKATLTFTLPEEAHDHDVAVNAGDLMLALIEIREWLRTKRKYGRLSPTARAFAEEAWLQLHEFLSERDVARFLF